jgi:hypothetical protein
MPSQFNGITVRESYQWMFCNTITQQADIFRRLLHVGFGPIPLKKSLVETVKAH